MPNTKEVVKWGMLYLHDQKLLGLPWQPSGQDFTQQGARVHSLVGELRFHKLVKFHTVHNNTNYMLSCFSVLTILKSVCVCLCVRMCAHARSGTRSCPTLFCAMDCSLAERILMFMEFSRQEHWSKLPFPMQGDLPDPGVEPATLASPALAGGFFTTGHLGSTTRISKGGLKNPNAGKKGTAQLSEWQGQWYF